MCGIIGAVVKNNISLNKRIATGIEELVHRGPDGFGMKIFDTNSYNISFGHTRLSIIDLSELGKQPMSSEDGRYCLTYNGEIYNYKELKEELINLGHSFQSRSDTEVLIKSWSEWGIDCLMKFKGMFAFTLLDKNEGYIFSARDAFGIKPFFYSMDEDDFYFSSEAPALLSILNKRLTLNDDSVIKYMYKGNYDSSENTFFNEVKSLEPGTFLRIDLDEQLIYTRGRWWNPSFIENKSISFSDAALHLRKLFLESVRIHMRSDVPIGAALSGGIDSSAIVCAMRYLEPNIPIHTFSYVADEESINEENWIDLVNEHVGAIPHKVTLNQDELINDIEDLILAQGEPFGSTSIYAQYMVFKAAQESGVKVVLEGQGADELLAGYYGYPYHRALSLMDHNKYLAVIKFLKNWSSRYEQPISPILKLLAQQKGKELLINLGLYGLRLKQKQKKTASLPNWLTLDKINLEDETEDKVVRSKGRRLTNELMRSVMGSNGMGLASLLRHGDRNAMKWSVEGRVPFLTTEIAEFLFSLPEEYLVSSNALTKNIFRHSMIGIVPEKILNRVDKIGFATPEKSLAKTLIYNDTEFIESMQGLSYFDVNELRKEIEDTLMDKVPFNWLPWRAINLSWWLKVNIENLTPQNIKN